MCGGGGRVEKGEKRRIRSFYNQKLRQPNEKKKWAKDDMRQFKMIANRRINGCIYK